MNENNTAIAWATSSQEQCRDHEWALADHDGARPTTTTPTKYRKKPVVIEAVQMPEAYPEGVDPSSDNYTRNLQAAAVLDFLREGLGEGTEDVVQGKAGWTIDPSDGALYISTQEGVMTASPGDWIIRGVKGEFYPCKPDIFEATYQAATPTPSETPDAVERAAEAILEACYGQELPEAPIDLARAALSALTETEETNDD